MLPITPDDVKRLYKPSRDGKSGRVIVPGVGTYKVVHDLGGALVMFRPEGAAPGYFGTVGHTAGHVFAETGAPPTWETLVAHHVAALLVSACRRSSVPGI